MEPIKRKRVTRVGSGAFSIYLPKKWIDGWPPVQQESREVDLHHVGAGLLIVPAHVEDSIEASIPAETAMVELWLLSAYLRGASHVTLKPQDGRFDNDAITAARDQLRHLDERIVARCTPDAIGWDLNPDLPPPATDAHGLLAALGAKVAENLRLAAEAVDTYGTDPDRALHAMQLLDRTHREDVSRLMHQAIRLVARIELPMEAVTDFQSLDLVAADLERVSGHAVRVADNILADYGLTREHLEYPRRHLLERLPERRPQSGMARDLVVLYRRFFRDAQNQLATLLECLNRPPSPTVATDLMHLLGELAQEQHRLADDVFGVIRTHWGEATADHEAIAAYGATKFSVLLVDILHAIGAAARHTVTLSAARPSV